MSDNARYVLEAFFEGNVFAYNLLESALNPIMFFRVRRADKTAIEEAVRIIARGGMAQTPLFRDWRNGNLFDVGHYIIAQARENRELAERYVNYGNWTRVIDGVPVVNFGGWTFAMPETDVSNPELRDLSRWAAMQTGEWPLYKAAQLFMGGSFASETIHVDRAMTDEYVSETDDLGAILISMGPWVTVISMGEVDGDAWSPGSERVATPIRLTEWIADAPSTEIGQKRYDAVIEDLEPVLGATGLLGIGVTEDERP